MAIRWIKNGEPHSAEVYNRPIRDLQIEFSGEKVPYTRRVSGEEGVRGGGSLNQDITISAVSATNRNIGVVKRSDELSQGYIDPWEIYLLLGRIGGGTLHTEPSASGSMGYWSEFYTTKAKVAVSANGGTANVHVVTPRRARSAVIATIVGNERAAYSMIPMAKRVAGSKCTVVIGNANPDIPLPSMEVEVELLIIDY